MLLAMKVIHLMKRFREKYYDVCKTGFVCPKKAVSLRSDMAKEMGVTEQTVYR